MFTNISINSLEFVTVDVGKTHKVVQSLAQVRLIKINVNVNQRLELITGLSDQQLTIRTIDSGVSIVDSVVLTLFAGRSLQVDTLLRDHLEGSQSKRAGFNGVGRSDDIGIGVRNVGVGVRVLEGCGVRIEGPASDVDLFALADGVGLEEGAAIVSNGDRMS